MIFPLLGLEPRIFIALLVCVGLLAIIAPPLLVVRDKKNQFNKEYREWSKEKQRIETLTQLKKQIKSKQKALYAPMKEVMNLCKFWQAKILRGDAKDKKEALMGKNRELQDKKARLGAAQSEKKKIIRNKKDLEGVLNKYDHMRLRLKKEIGEKTLEVEGFLDKLTNEIKFIKWLKKFWSEDKDDKEIARLNKALAEMRERALGATQKLSETKSALEKYAADEAKVDQNISALQNEIAVLNTQYRTLKEENNATDDRGRQILLGLK